MGRRGVSAFPVGVARNDFTTFNPDGSLDLFIQRESLGQDKEPNWLPAPASGSFTMNMRLYWPKPEVLDGSWVPPGVKLDMGFPHFLGWVG